MDVRDSGMAAVLQDLLPNNWVGQGLLRGERGLAVATRSRKRLQKETHYGPNASKGNSHKKLAKFAYQ